MSRDNSLWGEERIANELLVKLDIRVSPRTVRKYVRSKPGPGPRGDQRWRTFLRNHAAAIVACHPYRFLVHDRDSIYAQALDTSIANLRLQVLKTPYRSPKANSLCERLIGSYGVSVLTGRSR